MKHANGVVLIADTKEIAKSSHRRTQRKAKESTKYKLEEDIMLGYLQQGERKCKLEIGDTKIKEVQNLNI